MAKSRQGANAETLEANENAPSEELGATSTGHSLSLPTYSEGEIEEANALRMLDPSKILKQDPFQGCYVGVEDANDLNDTSTIFDEAQHLLSQAITKFRDEISQCEAELKKVSEDNTLISQLQQKIYTIGQLWSEVDQVKADCHQWKNNMDQLAVDKEAVMSQLASTEAQLQGIEEKGLTQAKKIEELEAELARTRAETIQSKAEAVQAKAEAKTIRVAPDKSNAMYFWDAAAVQVELKEASDRGKRSNDLAKHQAWRKTLEEIHARGFDLAEEIAEAKVRETVARFLVSSDDEDIVSGSEDGESEEDVPEGEKAPQDRATEGAVSECDASGDVASKID
ncbi:KNR4/SMI1 homolog [Nicotiana sylvestris]|uniref:KNR4/SMI1 homolog n=1 Tax=Nicotiana sylvestris TaxID=4096 RepID=UPI00388CCD31